jgi:hypothetical protein
MLYLQFVSVLFDTYVMEMSTRNIKIMFLGSKLRLVRRVDNLTAILFLLLTFIYLISSNNPDSYLSQCSLIPYSVVIMASTLYNCHWA